MQSRAAAALETEGPAVSHRTFRPHFLAALLTAAVASMGLWTAAADAAPGYAVTSITPWLSNAAPVGWSSSLNRVFYDSLGADGMFDGYSANPDGSNPQCLTCVIPAFAGTGANTNRGVSDISPDGKFALVTVERGDHLGVGANWTQPGKGGSNDIWLYSSDGSHAWPLTNITASDQQAVGTMWPRFDRTGNEIVWASMYQPAMANLGYWQLKVANIVWNAGVPSLANVRTIEPYANSFYEPYGFSPDDSHIIFASNADEPAWYDSQIDSIAVDGSGFSQLTTPVPGSTVNYNEFAFYTPSNDAIIYGSSFDAISGGLDYWTMNPDGSGQQQLTSFNDPWSPEARGYSVVAGLAFNPNNPNQFIASVASDVNAQNVNAVVVNLGPAPISSPAALGAAALPALPLAKPGKTTSAHNPASHTKTKTQPKTRAQSKTKAQSKASARHRRRVARRKAARKHHREMLRHAHSG
jgi:hypothetical protein